MRDKELQERIRARLTELDRSPITAAQAVGLERTYIRDFVGGKKSSIRVDKLDQVAQALDWTREELLNEVPAGGPRRPAATAKASAGPSQEAAAPPRTVQEVVLGPDVERDQHGPAIPVLGISAGGQESIGGREPDFMLNGDVVNYVARPKGLANANNVFSVYVTGDSMYPRYRERDLVILQKAAPAIGDDVVIELYPLSEGGEHPSFIKEFVARRGSYIVVKQFNPPKEIEFNMKEIRNIFRVIPTKEWVG